MALGKELLDRLEQCKPEAVYLSDEETQYTYAQVKALVSLRQHQLLQQGFKQGMRVFIATGRGVLYWIDCLAVWGLGGVVMPLDVASDQARVEYLFCLVAPDFILCEKLRYTTQAKQLTFPDSHDDDFSLVRISVDDFAIAAILFTSGSTGLPKAVKLSDRALLGNAKAVMPHLNYGKSDSLFFAIGFQFVSAFSHFLVTTLKSSAIFCTEKLLFKSELVDALIKQGSTCFGGSPIQLRWLAEDSRLEQLKHLKWLMASGDHLPAVVIKALKKTLPNLKIHTVYGLTELGGRFCFLSPNELPEQAGFVGKPIMGLKLTIRDEAGKPVKLGEIGEVYAEGEYLLDEYIGIPESREFKKTGFNTGDSGFINAKGNLCLSGRSDNVFKCMGKKVSTLPITEALIKTGYFSDVIVVAIDDKNVGGRVPVAFYALKSDVVFKKGVFIRELRKELPSDYLPYAYIALPTLPRTGSGKPLYQKLKAFYDSY
ncbi:MAG: hypothetical protein COV52_00405 [Gammaproteobacteria bacterium CG11_big_fil_rev_8_21_14_0_20_46_22]|nr:MAG: hypothetical protein COW05_09110 [Gammaproteobacteria bacterium CG12_big_fil_rev_8_21_14_0_65_46_12]PIR12117.1 MAG: hypothetical protein COV52_00405 [Gammaproteobacteria bacterium CG11_big_fil_rev_8_21_14_0_20_46_22]